MVIQLKNIIQSGFTNSDGDIIFNIIQSHFINEDIIEISFLGMGAVSSSFVNSAFLKLLDFYEFDDIKKKIKFTNTLKIHTDLIKSRFIFESERRVPSLVAH